MAKFVEVDGRTGYPRFWFEDSKQAIGPNTITICCRTNVKLDEDESNLWREWRIRVFNSEGTRTYSGTVENNTIKTTIRNIPVTLGEKNIITAEVRISYINADGDIEYLRGDEDGYDRVKVDDEYNEILGIGSKNGEDTLIAYTRNKAIYTGFWKNGTVNISSGKYISDHITSDNVEQWLEQLRIWKSWYE